MIVAALLLTLGADGGEAPRPAATRAAPALPLFVFDAEGAAPPSGGPWACAAARGAAAGCPTGGAGAASLLPPPAACWRPSPAAEPSAARPARKTMVAPQQWQT